MTRPTGPLESILFPRFRRVRGAVVRTDLTSAMASRRLRGFRCAYRVAILENEENHEHFDHDCPGTPRDRWLHNLDLARCARRAWMLALAEQFPAEPFASVIWNEVSASLSDEGTLDATGARIVPVLRLWSERNDPAGEFSSAFRVHAAREDAIALVQSNRPVFVPETEVFTKTGGFRNAFCRRLDKGGALRIRIRR